MIALFRPRKRVRYNASLRLKSVAIPQVVRIYSRRFASPQELADDLLERFPDLRGMYNCGEILSIDFWRN